MSEYKLKLVKREVAGKKTKVLRAAGLIPSVVFGGKEPVMTSSEYVPTEKVLEKASYHSPIDLEIDGKKKMAIVKEVHIDPVSRKIMNVEFQAISAKEVVEATTPIVIKNFEASEASKTYKLVLTQVMKEIDVKAKPADLPEDLEVDAAGMKNVEDKITVADLKLPAGVEIADKELDSEQVVASLYDPAAETEKRETEEAAPAEVAEEAAEEEKQ